jgi:hypothetical protein
VYPRSRLLIPVQLAAASAALAVAGCGGGGTGEQVAAAQKVTGPGFTFSAPVEREIARTLRSVTVLPAETASPELEQVTRFPLVKTFRPSLWPGASAELDGVAERLTTSLGGEYGNAPKTVRRGGSCGQLRDRVRARRRRFASAYAIARPKRRTSRLPLAAAPASRLSRTL